MVEEAEEAVVVELSGEVVVEAPVCVLVLHNVFGTHERLAQDHGIVAMRDELHESR